MRAQDVRARDHVAQPRDTRQAISRAGRAAVVHAHRVAALHAAGVTAREAGVALVRLARRALAHPPEAADGAGAADGRAGVGLRRHTVGVGRRHRLRGPSAATASERSHGNDGDEGEAR